MNQIIMASWAGVVGAGVGDVAGVIPGWDELVLERVTPTTIKPTTTKITPKTPIEI